MAEDGLRALGGADAADEAVHPVGVGDAPADVGVHGERLVDGVAARVVNGFLPGEYNEAAGASALRAKGETVRSLKVTVKAPADSDEEEWFNLRAEVSPESWPKLDEGLRVAGVIIGAAATKKQRVAAWGEEYLGSHPAPADEHADDVLFASEDDFELASRIDSLA